MFLFSFEHAPVKEKNGSGTGMGTCRRDSTASEGERSNSEITPSGMEPQAFDVYFPPSHLLGCNLTLLSITPPLNGQRPILRPRP